MRKRLHPGICRHAREFGVSHGHLVLVAQGKRHSPDLLARYNAILEAERAAVPLAEERAAVFGVTVLAEQSLPKFQAATSDSERESISDELASQIREAYPNFEAAFAAVESALTNGQKARLLDALLPFYAMAFRQELAAHLPDRPAVAGSC